MLLELSNNCIKVAEIASEGGRLTLEEIGCDIAPKASHTVGHECGCAIMLGYRRQTNTLQGHHRSEREKHLDVSKSPLNARSACIHPTAVEVLD
jgi:hypothetical protein